MNVGTTRRSPRSAAGALRHAVRPTTFDANALPGRTIATAYCGARLGRIFSITFDPDHPRACPRCAKVST